VPVEEEEKDMISWLRWIEMIQYGADIFGLESCPQLWQIHPEIVCEHGEGTMNIFFVSSSVKCL